MLVTKRLVGMAVVFSPSDDFTIKNDIKISLQKHLHIYFKLSFDTLNFFNPAAQVFSKMLIIKVVKRHSLKFLLDLQT